MLKSNLKKLIINLIMHIQRVIFLKLFTKSQQKKMNNPKFKITRKTKNIN